MMTIPAWSRTRQNPPSEELRKVGIIFQTSTWYMSDVDAQPRSLKSDAFHNKPRTNTKGVSSVKQLKNASYVVACIRQIVPKHGFGHIPTPIPSAPGIPEGW